MDKHTQVLKPTVLVKIWVLVNLVHRIVVNLCLEHVFDPLIALTTSLPGLTLDYLGFNTQFRAAFAVGKII